MKTDDEFLPTNGGGNKSEKVDLAVMQAMAEENDILLPLEYNTNVVSTTEQDEDDDILIPPNL